VGLGLWLLSWLPSERMHRGTAETFDRARKDFEAAWRVFSRSGPKPIFKHGEISGTGQQGNIAASIGTSVCRPDRRASG